MLTVGILADLPEGLGGGVNTFTRALVRSLAGLTATEMRLVVFASGEERAWVPADGRVSVVGVEPFRLRRGWRRWQERVERYGTAALKMMQNDQLAARVAGRFGDRTRRILRAVAQSPWPLDVMHFPFQSAAPVGAPSIFGLWDLQHLHLPELRPAAATAELDRYYRWCVRETDCITFGSEWARQDALKRYALEPERTRAVYAASPLRVVPEPVPGAIDDVRRRYSLPPRFAFYPAATWPHKNHRRLVEALARLRSSGVSDLHLVCSGQSSRHREHLTQEATALGVDSRVHFLGHVPDVEVKCLYRLATFCVFPSLFEGAGLPILEAFDERCPVAASRVASIPEYAGEAAVLFDPTSIEAIADAMTRMATDTDLRANLADRGTERARHFSWERTVAAYQGLYSEVASWKVAATGRHRRADAITAVQAKWEES
jgi:glycosyltransferase involved in cell wall biosynthesis